MKEESIMKKIKMIMAVAAAIALVGCGSNPEPEMNQVDGMLPEKTEQVKETEAAAEASEEVTLGVPQVKDGVLVPGEDAAEVHFEWDPVEGADGYEVSVTNKYYAEKEYREPAETVETTDTVYVDSAQDYFDFRIQVRAFKGDGADRVYGDWSSFAEGSAYTEEDIAADGN